MFNEGFAFFELGSFSRFCVFNQRDAGPHFLTTVGHRGKRHREAPVHPSPHPTLDTWHLTHWPLLSTLNSQL
jgi:hypothetical protein